MAKIEKIGNIQIVDNKEDKFFYFPMISMACTGSGMNIWCTQKALAQLFDCSTEDIGLHLKNIYHSGELSQYATVSKMEIAELIKFRGFLGR